VSAPFLPSYEISKHDVQFSGNVFSQIECEY